MAVLLSVVY